MWLDDLPNDKLQAYADAARQRFDNHPDRNAAVWFKSLESLVSQIPADLHHGIESVASQTNEEGGVVSVDYANVGDCYRNTVMAIGKRPTRYDDITVEFHVGTFGDMIESLEQEGFLFD
jgi:hypothetical protein